VARGSNMDPIHHSKIVDKLMQYRGKLPKDGYLGDRIAVCAAYELRQLIDNLIWQIESFAVLDDQGLIR
jgi:hypothetical protein